MGVSKTEQFTQKENRLAVYAKAIAHPARVSILHFLSSKNDCVCGHIVDELPLSQSTVSQHLKELKQIGFIQGEIEGAKTCYCINDDEIEKAKKAIVQFFDEIKTRRRCC